MNPALEDPQSEVAPIDRYTDWYGFDTENDKDGKVTIAALIHESGESWVWKKAGDFAKWCDKQKGNKPVVICHNLEYDLVNEFGRDHYADMQLNYLKGKLISARRGNVRFLDSFNHFRMSLKEIGEAIGVKKLDMDINSSEYVTTDSWICLQVMTKARDYIASLGGQIGATSGSSALSVWKYMTDGEYCTGPHDTPFLRAGYYGGRTEIFRPLAVSRPISVDGQEWDIRLNEGQETPEYAFNERGFPYKTGLKLKAGDWDVARERDIKGYDINSMFPFCMLNDFPEYLMEDPHMDKAKGMVEATISVPEDMHVAPLVYRDANGALIYPVGVFRGTWTYDEISMAVRVGCKVIKVHKALGCNTLVRPFDQFIKTLYAKRKVSKDESERLFLKVLMNSLYGKIASKNTVTRTVSRYNLMQNLKDKKISEARMAEVKWINYHRGLLDYFTPQQDYVNVCWGSMITAYARNLLTHYLWQVPPEKLIYCDTDSIYCINHELEISKELGGMKLEKEASVMEVLQPKAYRLDDYWKAKGVPKPRMVDDATGGKVEVNFARQYMMEGFAAFEAPIRFRASLTSKRGRANQWVTHSKSMKSGYTHKPLSGDRYVPPRLSDQLDLGLGGCNTKKPNGTKKAK